VWQDDVQQRHEVSGVAHIDFLWPIALPLPASFSQQFNQRIRVGSSEGFNRLDEKLPVKALIYN
jgi:hypothetical protein